MEEIEFRTEPFIVDLTVKNKMPDTIDQTMVQTTNEDKDFYLYYFLTRYPGRTIIFVNAITCLLRLISVFKLLKIPVLGLHANMQQRQRLKNLDRFKESSHGILIASDVAARYF